MNARKWTVQAEPERLGCAAETRRFLLEQGIARPLALRAELCVAELAGNAARHAKGGVVEVKCFTDRIEIHVVDRGPGIADVAQALDDGVSGGKMRTPDAPQRGTVGTGTGLGAVARTADQLELQAREGGGLHALARLNVSPRSELASTADNKRKKAP